MKELTAVSKTMSSREIAKLTGKDHHHVKDKIEKVLFEAEISAQDFADVQVVRGREVGVYNLPKRECDLVMSGYSVKYRLMIIDRWNELEEGSVQLPQVTENLELRKLELQIELAKLKSNDLSLTEKTKQLEIEAKVKLGRKKTGIRRIPSCPSGFTNMKRFERMCEDADEPIPLSFLKGILNFYVTKIDTRGNCIHVDQFNSVLDDVFFSLVEDGEYMKHPDSGLRVLTVKLDWYDF